MVLHSIKVNLPETEDHYQHGSGEGCWALIDDEAFEAYNNNETSGTFFAILNNDSLEYPRFTAGTRILCEFRGEKRPVVPFSYLNDPQTPIEKIDMSDIMPIR